MRVLLLGCGLQGRATLYDLARSSDVTHVTCADRTIEFAQAARDRFGRPGFVAAAIDVTDSASLNHLVSQGFDVIIDMLPRDFVQLVAQAAIAGRTHLVNTYYDHALRPLAEQIADAEIAVLPEMGFDPGIDLLMARHAVDRFGGNVRALYSYGGGVPEGKAAIPPLQYKISWNFEGVLNSYCRPALLMQDGMSCELAADEIFLEENLRQIQVARVGTLEAFPNGDAIYYSQLLGIESTIKNTGRYALRYPGHGAVWHTLKKLGLLDQEPVKGLGNLSPRQFLRHHLEPRLQYNADEQDIVISRTEAESVDEQAPRLILELVDYRDLESGLLAMNRTVGYPASIAAQMIVNGTINRRGLLNPVRDVPYEPFRQALSDRGIHITEQLEPKQPETPAAAEPPSRKAVPPEPETVK